MEILQTVVSALVVASVGLILARLAGQRFDVLEATVGRVEQRLDARIDVLDAKFESKFDALEGKFDGKFDRLDRKFDAKIDALRADITQIALAVGARPTRETG